MNKYPLSQYDVFIVGPCLVKNGEDLLEWVPQGYEELLKFDVDDGKGLISYVDYKTKESFFYQFDASFKCWFSSGSMLHQGMVYVCKKESEATKLVSLLSDEELMEEVLRRVLNKAENKKNGGD